MIGLIMLGSMINYLTRSTLAVAAPTLLNDLHIGTQQYSWIVGTFQGAIMMQPLCGYVLDVIGLKRGYALFAVAWSFISMAHGLAHNWQMLAVLRGLLGLAEGSANPAGMKATAEWFPAKERGLAGGIYNIGASFGSMLAPPLVAWAILQYNWQAAFVITGALGLIWVTVWLWLYQPPENHPALSSTEFDYIAAGQEKHLQHDGTRPAVLSLLRRRNFWGIALPRFLADPTWGTLTFWMPLYLAQTRGWDLKQIALFAWLPFLAADIGCIFGGAFSMWLQKHWRISLINARRAAFTARRRHDARGRLRRLRRKPLCCDCAAQPRRLRPSNVVRDRDHDVFGFVQEERSGDSGGDGGHVRQRRAADLLAVDRRAGIEDRLHTILHLSWLSGRHRRGDLVDCGEGGCDGVCNG